MAFDVVIQVNGQPDAELIASSALVEVCECIGEPTTYRIEFPLTSVDNDFPLLRDGRVGPGAELSIATAREQQLEVLCVGQVYGQRVHLEHNVDGSRVFVLGGDKTFEMDRAIVQKVWTGVKVSDAISSILSPYVDKVSVDGIKTQYDEKSHELVQCETDLRFLRRLARRYGCWFRVATDQHEVTTAYFQRPVLSGSPAATLVINQGPDDSQLDQLDIEWDIERPSVAQGDQLPLRSKSAFSGDLDKSPLAPLGAIPFGDVATNQKEVRVVAPMDDAGDFKARSEAALIDAGWFVRARGVVTARSLKAVLHAHSVVQLKGAGSRHSGKYVVASVRHVFDVDNHKMHFELIRNAWEA